MLELIAIFSYLIFENQSMQVQDSIVFDRYRKNRLSIFLDIYIAF